MTGYPTLKFFKKGEDSAEKYRGGRDLNALHKYVAKQLGLEVEVRTEMTFYVSFQI